MGRRKKHKNAPTHSPGPQPPSRDVLYIRLLIFGVPTALLVILLGYLFIDYTMLDSAMHRIAILGAVMLHFTVRTGLWLSGKIPLYPPMAEITAIVLSSFILFAFLLLPLLFFMNCTLDDTRPIAVRALVESKRKVTTKSTSFFLQVSSAEPQVHGKELRVSSPLWEEAKPGDTLIIGDLHPGRLGFAWYRNPPYLLTGK